MTASILNQDPNKNKITPKIRMLCFILINSIILNLLYVWILFCMFFHVIKCPGIQHSLISSVNTWQFWSFYVFDVA